eukprot:RCo024699
MGWAMCLLHYQGFQGSMPKRVCAVCALRSTLASCSSPSPVTYPPWFLVCLALFPTLPGRDVGGNSSPTQTSAALFTLLHWLFHPSRALPEKVSAADSLLLGFTGPFHPFCATFYRTIAGRTYTNGRQLPSSSISPSLSISLSSLSFSLQTPSPFSCNASVLELLQSGGCVPRRCSLLLVGKWAALEPSNQVLVLYLF